MTRLKGRLRAGLKERGWEIVLIDEEGVDWWGAGHWTLESVREAYGKRLILTFLVDPMFEGPSKWAGVYELFATEEMPTGHPYSDGGRRLRLHDGRLDTTLPEFLDSLEACRVA